MFYYIDFIYISKIFLAQPKKLLACKLLKLLKSQYITYFFTGLTDVAQKHSYNTILTTHC